MSLRCRSLIACLFQCPQKLHHQPKTINAFILCQDCHASNLTASAWQDHCLRISRKPSVQCKQLHLAARPGLVCILLARARQSTCHTMTVDTEPSCCFPSGSLCMTLARAAGACRAVSSRQHWPACPKVQDSTEAVPGPVGLTGARCMQGTARCIHHLANKGTGHKRAVDVLLLEC